MENKIYANPKYKCAICGSIFDEIPERVKCESACLKKQAEEAKRAEEEKKKLEKAVRKAEVDAAIKKALELENAYIKDYGSYIYGDYKLEDFTKSTLSSDDLMTLKWLTDLIF